MGLTDEARAKVWRAMTQRFQFIPAVDLLDGKVVRLMQGEYDKSTVYGEDPAEPIREFIRAGVELIHIVDLNAARKGDRSVNREAVESIVRAAKDEAPGDSPGVRLELGGGVRDMAAVEHYLTLGISRCIIGTAAVSKPDFVREALAKHGPEKIIVGVDARDGRVKVAGWEEDGGISVNDLIQRLEGDGIREIIFTDIATDGAMTGPALDSLRDVLSRTKELRVVASGGVSSLADVRGLLELREPRIAGAISGRAVYEKKLAVREAVELCREFN